MPRLTPNRKCKKNETILAVIQYTVIFYQSVLKNNQMIRKKKVFSDLSYFYSQCETWACLDKNKWFHFV